MTDLGKLIDAAVKVKNPTKRQVAEVERLLTIARNHYMTARRAKDVNLMTTIGNQITRIHDWQAKHG